MSSDGGNEQTPLLQRKDSDVSIVASQERSHVVDFHECDHDDPRQWAWRKKILNVCIISLMALLSPLASSMFTPAIKQIAVDLNTDEQHIIATTTGYVVMLGIGPLILAPLSETFGRRRLYLTCFGIFALLQIPTALSPNAGFIIAIRTVAGFFGSVGIANGGGSLNDMFHPSERAGVYGIYLSGVLLGPTLGPLFGGLIVDHLNWRWIYWVLAIVCLVNTITGFLFLYETYPPTILRRRKQRLEEADRQNKVAPDEINYSLPNEDTRPLHIKLLSSFKRPLVIFIQPIILTMSFYQALIFGTTYSIYTNMQPIYSSPPYKFNTQQTGLLYLSPGLGFLVAVAFIVPRIDTVYNALTAKNHGKAVPEYRLPLANIGAVLLPLALIAFAWTVEFQLHWAITIVPTFFYGIGQVSILNTVQNYYIDSFERYAASAIAAGAVFRSILGGIVPLFAPQLFDSLGYGWGISVFAFLSVLLAPSPILFYKYGGRIRDKFQLKF